MSDKRAAETVEQAREGLSKEKTKLHQRFARLRARRPAVRHTVEAWQLNQSNNGNQYAAAITYWTFLSLFPLLLLAVSITGFVLHAHPAAEQSLFDHLTQSAPGDLGKTLHTSLQSAINARASLGIVGLVGVLLTGLGWIGNLRSAIDAVWGLTPAKRNFLAARALNLLVLAGLGLGLLVSLGITAVRTSLIDEILSALNVSHVVGVSLVVTLFGIAIAVVGDFVIFFWMMVRLPQIDVPKRAGRTGALLAAVGFEILKIVGTYTIAHTAQSPVAGPFASVLAILIWIQLVARYLLLCTAYTAVLTREQEPVKFVDVTELPGAPGTLIAREPTGMSWSQVARVAGLASVVGAFFGSRAAQVPRPDEPDQGTSA